MSADEYLRRLIPLTKSPVLNRQREYALNNNIPVLLPETANFIELIVRMTNPRNILEIGTAIGYSGLLMLENAKRASLTTIEVDEDTLLIAKEFFCAAGVKDRVLTHLGDAKLIVPMLSGEYDLIFLDGPKSSYIEFLPYLYDLLPYGGVLICDNVLYKGWITGERTPPKHKHNTIIKNIDNFCRTIFGYKDFVTSILPLGDGVSVSYKQTKN